MNLARGFSKARPGRKRTFDWLVALSVLLLVVQVEAAGSSAIEAIRGRMDEGQGLFITGKYEEAAAVFESGYQSHPYSAFLFNAGVCHQKIGQSDKALAAFRLYLEKDPSAPDALQVRERVAKLEAALAAVVAPPSQGTGGDTATPEPLPIVPDDTDAKMKSLVVIETEPTNVPIKIFQRLDPSAPAFGENSPNTGWRLVAERHAPTDFTLDVGRYHIVVEKFHDFNRSETDIDVSPGHVHQFKANLSQGAFMAFLRVNSNVPGAYLFVDDDGSKKVAWGRAPYGELIPPGAHTVLVEAPGFEPQTTEIELTTGEQKELTVELVRVGFGIVRIDANVPAVSVFVANKPAGTWKRGEVALQIKLPAGAQQLLITADGHKDLRTTVDVPRGQVLPMRADMIASYPRGAAWAQAIVAASLIGASTYFALESNRLDAELRADRAAGNLTASDPRLDQGFWYSAGADGGFVLGGIFGGLSIYNFLKDPYPDSSLRRGKRQEFESQRDKLPESER